MRLQPTQKAACLRRFVLSVFLLNALRKVFEKLVNVSNTTNIHLGEFPFTLLRLTRHTNS